ncbi:MAG: hypothetical protein JST00_02090 [Deltaproteobacteria bacterium]|nr:hypothetical protein [Deltaproteobacteria bacterium]
MSCARIDDIDRHFAERLSPTEEHAMREHLPSCDECRRRYERHLLIERLDPAARGPGARLASGLGLGPRREGVVLPIARRAVPLALAAAAAAVLVVHGLPRREAPESLGFTARGGAPSAQVGEGPEVTVYRRSASSADASAERAGASIRRSDELAFAYRNPGAKRYLMIYGVDDRRRVYWYYPVWTDPAANPSSIEVERADAARQLPDAVRHELEGRELEIHALFTDSPLDVRSVEAKVASGAPPAATELVTRFHVDP